MERSTYKNNIIEDNRNHKIKTICTEINGIHLNNKNKENFSLSKHNLNDLTEVTDSVIRK